MNGFVIGGMLIVWIAILAAILLRRDNKLPGRANNFDLLVPVGITLAVWMWIFGLVVFTTI